LTLARAVAVPVLTFLLAFRLGGFLTGPARAAAGLVAGGALLLAATFTRMGTSIMSDVPAMFWVLITVFLAVSLWPPRDQPAAMRPNVAWAAAVGAALGVAVFVRYASVLVAVPLIAYLGMRARAPLARWELHLRHAAAPAGVAIVAFGVMLLPQALYLLTHEAGPESGTYFGSMSVGNIVSRSSTGLGGPDVFPHTMIEFYALSPLRDAAGGFLHAAFMPLVLIGLVVLLVRRQWPALVLLIIWWLLPAISYATTPYQTHRYALVYLPAIAVLAGFGAASGIEGVVRALRRRSSLRLLASAAVTVVVIILFAYGAARGWRSVRDWQSTHAAWQAADEALARAAQSASGAVSVRAVCFPACAPLDFYAGMPALDLYNNNEQALAAFIRPGSTIAVFSEKSIDTQWAGTSVAQRRRWLSETYRLEPAAESGEHIVYRVESRSLFVASHEHDEVVVP
jgi:general stress protein CsbA